MAKKKQKQTPKDDLIDSILNDVQELNDQDTKHERNAAADLFLGDYENTNPKKRKKVAIGLDSDQEPLDEMNAGAAQLWQQIKGSPDDPSDMPPEPPSAEDSSDLESLDSEDSVPSFEVPEESIKNYPEGFKVTPDSADNDETININELAKQQQAAAAAEEYPENISDSEDSAIHSEEEDSERTVAVEGFANRKPRQKEEISPKISFGSLRGSRQTSGSVYASADATLLQAESLKLAQLRILELEKEVEKYRAENEELASAGDIIRNRAEELTSRIFALEGEKQEVYDSLQNELMIVKGSLQYKESELAKGRLKIDELETRLKSDFKKIRVRERELENRLELIKAEKSALLRAKDENILELKRKIDHLESELDNYRRKVLELNKTIDTNQEQFKRTVRALRLALSNLEVKEENVVPLKKAE